MESRVIKFETGADTYRRLAGALADDDKFTEALGLLFSALKKFPKDGGVITDIGDIYADMSLWELSNKFWFYYLATQPKEKAGVAYEELGINYFYLDNLFAAGYYFHLKLATDGSFSREDFGDEINDFLNNVQNDLKEFRIVYPYERADYSLNKKLAKKAYALGDYDAASAVYSAIPHQCLTEDDGGELAVSLFMCGDDDEVLKVCKNSLIDHGENLTAYCNLCALYNARGDADKSAYYYKKALSLRKFDKDEPYKLIPCALEQHDHDTAIRCIEDILADRPSDPWMLLFYGFALANVGRFTKAAEQFNAAYRVAPYIRPLGFYAEYFRNAAKGEFSDDKKLLPLEYVRGYQPKTVNRFKRIIKNEDLLVPPDFDKKPETLRAYIWGVLEGNDEIAKKCALSLAMSKNPAAQNALDETLLDPAVSDSRKSLIVFMYTLFEIKGSFGAVASDCFVKIKAGKLVLKGKPLDQEFRSAYALAVSKSVFAGFIDFNKLVFCANALYKDRYEEVAANEFSQGEIAALILVFCKDKRLSDVKKACKLFDVQEKRIKDFIENCEEK